MLFSRISRKRFLVEYQRILRSPLCSFGFVLVLFLSVSLVQLFFVCCWALLKAIYFTSFSFLVLEFLLICVSVVSLWFILRDCCFVVVYLLWCNCGRLHKQNPKTKKLPQKTKETNKRKPTQILAVYPHLVLLQSKV